MIDQVLMKMHKAPISIGFLQTLVRRSPRLTNASILGLMTLALVACDTSLSVAPSHEWEKKPLLEWRELDTTSTAVSDSASANLSKIGFDHERFKAPPTDSLPAIRWWWPGGAVDESEALSEISQLQTLGFGGVDIRVSTQGLPEKLSRSSRAAINSYDSPNYYEKTQRILNAVKGQGLRAFMQAGAGDALGGAHITSEDAPQVYAAKVAETTTEENSAVSQQQALVASVPSYPLSDSQRLDPLANAKVAAHLDYLFGQRVSPFANFDGLDGINLFLSSYGDHSLAVTGFDKEPKENSGKRAYGDALTNAYSLGVLSAVNTWVAAKDLTASVALPNEQLNILDLAGMAGGVSNELCENCDQEARQKLLSSGAALHARSTSTAVIPLTYGHISPSLLIQGAAELLMAGANNFVVNGLAHDSQINGKGSSWQPYGAINLSDLNADSYLNYQGYIQNYLGRAQQLAQLGKPQLDVLIYYPWQGWPLASEASAKWMDEQLPILRAIESAGLRWAWVGDADLQAASLSPLGIKVHAAVVKSVLFLNSPFLAKKTASHLQSLDTGGAAFWRFGDVPNAMPSVEEGSSSAEQAEQALSRFFGGDLVAELEGADELIAWARSSVGGLSFRLEETAAGVQLMTRSFENGAVHFFYNRGNQGIELRFKAAGHAHRLNLATGEALPIEPLREQYRLRLAPGELVPVLVQVFGVPLSDNVASAIEPVFQPIARLQPESSTATGSSARQYVMSMTKGEDSEFHRFRLQAEGLRGVLKVSVNGKQCANLLLSPYLAEIESCLQAGENKITAELIGQDASVDVVWMSGF